MTIADVFNLDIPYAFGANEECWESDELSYVIKQLPRGTEYNWGVSKFVIFIDDHVVIKIPFDGQYEYNCEIDDIEFIEFSDKCKNYCQREADIYQKAVGAGVAEFFAETRYIGHTITHTPLYQSERVETEVSMFGRSSAESRTKALEKKDVFRNTDWLAAAYDYYGTEKVEKFLSFVKENEINDFHSGNVGLRNNIAPVIIDYSSFFHN